MNKEQILKAQEQLEFEIELNKLMLKMAMKLNLKTILKILTDAQETVIKSMEEGERAWKEQLKK